MSSDADIVRANFAKVIGTGTAPEDMDQDADMEDYGLTSLDKILFLTAVCDSTGIELSAFTEQDLSDMRTLRDVIEAISLRAGRVAGHDLG